ncbi:MAG: hypothetical protein ACKPKO_45065, partial [Candidatus Fonsibacter sp.]
MPKQRPPLVGSVLLVVAAAAASLPKASGMEVVTCSMEMMTQQCTSVSTDEGTHLGSIAYGMIVFLFMMLTIYVLRWFSKRSEGRRTSSPRTHDASTQTETYEHYSNHELDAMLAERLNNPNFPLSYEGDTMLVRDYTRRGEYKSVGATYYGSAKAWFVLAGDSVRPF